MNTHAHSLFLAHDLYELFYLQSFFDSVLEKKTKNLHEFKF